MKIVVKLGGATLEDAALLQRAVLAVKQLAQEHQVAVVHGGGAALTRMLAQMGKASEFIDGLRVTDAETRDFAVMVLAGHMNKKLVAALGSVGQSAMGMCGGDGQAFRARKKTTNGHDLGFVGEISSVDPRWIETIWQQGCIPVISSVALGSDGQYYNINADQMASACAVACHANALIFLTDVPGVKDADGLGDSLARSGHSRGAYAEAGDQRRHAAQIAGLQGCAVARRDSRAHSARSGSGSAAGILFHQD